jgi:outer membrane immunogenic protein
MVTNNLSAKAEYLFTSVGSDRYFGFSPAAIQTSVENSQVKVGVNYHF